MREILFRGKEIGTEKWIEGSLIIILDQYYIQYHPKLPNSKPIPIRVYIETVGQFTGLLDKNGNKIFEGDILKCINPNNGEEYITDFTASMVNGFTFKNTRLTRELAIYNNDWPDEIEVIGNVIDNSNLLL